MAPFLPLSRSGLGSVLLLLVTVASVLYLYEADLVASVAVPQQQPEAHSFTGRARTARDSDGMAHVHCVDRILQRLVPRTIVIGCVGEGIGLRVSALMQEAGVFVGNASDAWAALEDAAASVPQIAEGTLNQYMWKNTLGSSEQHSELVERVRLLLEQGLFIPLRLSLLKAVAGLSADVIERCDNAEVSSFRAAALPMCRSFLLLPLLERLLPEMRFVHVVREGSTVGAVLGKSVLSDLADFGAAYGQITGSKLARAAMASPASVTKQQRASLELYALRLWALLVHEVERAGRSLLGAWRHVTMRAEDLYGGGTASQLRLQRALLDLGLADAEELEALLAGAADRLSRPGEVGWTLPDARKDDIAALWKRGKRAEYVNRAALLLGYSQ